MDSLDCAGARRLLDALLDRQLDIAAELALDAHLAGCPECRRRLEARQAVSRRIREEAPRHLAPPRLAARILAALPRETAAPPAARATGRRVPLPHWHKAAWTASAMALAASLALYLGTPHGLGPDVDGDLLSAQLRSLVPGHLTDVLSSDQHTVKPWFDGRVSLSPPVPDLADVGFPLAGGRLDYVGDKQAAALVYRRNRHLINLFAWADPGADRPLAVHERNGYHLLEWRRDGIAYAAVSDVNLDDLKGFQQQWEARAGADDKGEPAAAPQP